MVPYTFGDPHKATISGTAFDYMARFLIAQKVNHCRDAVLTDLVAEHIFLYHSMRWWDYGKEKEAAYRKYKKHVKRIQTLIESNSLLNNPEAASICVLFAKIEQESRAGRQRPPVFEITDEDQEIIQDVMFLSQTFANSFLPTVEPDSVVIFNPRFGIGSRVVGGADADIFINGTLIDFKVKKDNNWSSALSRQLIGYYVLDSIAKDAKDDRSDLREQRILRVALYNARYAETDFYDISNIDLQQLEIIKADIRHEFLMRKMRNYDYDILKSLHIPLTEDELHYCSDDTELEIDVWQEINPQLSKEILKSWQSLDSFLREVDTNYILQQIIQ